MKNINYKHNKMVTSISARKVLGGDFYTRSAR